MDWATSVGCLVLSMTPIWSDSNKPNITNQCWIDAGVYYSVMLACQRPDGIISCTPIEPSRFHIELFCIPGTVYQPSCTKLNLGLP